jgi:hypothetical protein
LAYRNRLRDWESREQKRARDYEIDKKNEINRRRQVQKDKKKLKQFLEDYDDEKDDEDFYKNLNLSKRLKMREKEIELDNRDRQREKDELEELKQKLLAKSNQNPDSIDGEIKKVRYFVFGSFSLFPHCQFRIQLKDPGRRKHKNAAEVRNGRNVIIIIFVFVVAIVIRR